MPLPWKIHRQMPLKMIEPRKTALLTVKKKKTTTTKTERISWQHEWKNIRCMLHKADTPRLRSTMQNICFLISISAVTLKLISNGQNHIHFWLIQVLKNSMTWYFLTFRPLSSKLEFVYSVSPVILRSRRENAHLLVNPIPKLTIVLNWKTPPCLKFGKTSNRAVKNLPQRKLWVWAANEVNDARSHWEFDHTELRWACASSETIDLRTLEFGLISARCSSTSPCNNSWYARASPRVKKGSFPSFLPFYFCTRTFSIQLTRPSRSLDQVIDSRNNRSDSDS